MNNWILLTIIYAVFVSINEVFKKKAIKINSIYEFLAYHCFFSFILCALITNDAFLIDYTFFPAIIIKSLIIVVAWILGVKAIEGLQLSIYGLVKITRILFSVLLSFLILGERFSTISIIGMGIVIIGLVLVNTRTDNGPNRKNSYKIILLFMVSCFLSDLSAIIDKKVLMYISSSQLQFWFMFFLAIFYWTILLIKGKKINTKKLTTNFWIPLSSVCLVFGDRLYFRATEIPSSKVAIMSILKQLSIVISIIFGGLIFHEKDIFKKLLYSLLIIAGAVITIIF